MADPQSGGGGKPSQNPWPDSVYEDLREKLIKFFEGRNLSPAEEFAHIVLQRLLAKLDRLFTKGPTEKDRGYEGLIRIYDKHTAGMNLADDQVSADDLRRYALGMAKKVYLEGHRAPKTVQLPESDWSTYEPVDPVSSDEKNLHRQMFPAEVLTDVEQCMHDCMESQRPQKKKLLLNYYETDRKKHSEHRKRIAELMNMNESALYAAVCRARGDLRKCVCVCLERVSPKSYEIWCKDKTAPLIT
jgi:DNA-directed RNA polymerase specialized sigma24 family protein